MMNISEFDLCSGVGDLHRYPGPQEHHRLQSVGEAGSERGQAPVGGALRGRLRCDVSSRHRHRHHCDRGSAEGWCFHPGGAGGAGGRDVCLHHLPRDPSPWAELPWAASAQSLLPPVWFLSNGWTQFPGLKNTWHCLCPVARKLEPGGHRAFTNCMWFKKTKGSVYFFFFFFFEELIFTRTKMLMSLKNVWSFISFKWGKLIIFLSTEKIWHTNGDIFFNVIMYCFSFFKLVIFYQWNYFHAIFAFPLYRA